jgi:hypothetical protein
VLREGSVAKPAIRPKISGGSISNGDFGNGAKGSKASNNIFPNECRFPKS